MDYKKVAEVYKKSNAATLSMSEYVPLLLTECLDLLRLYEESPENLQKELILKAQQLIFKLMANTNRLSVEGSRSLAQYMQINQCLDQVRLTQSNPHVKKAEKLLLETMKSWQDAKPIVKK